MIILILSVYKRKIWFINRKKRFLFQLIIIILASNCFSGLMIRPFFSKKKYLTFRQVFGCHILKPLGWKKKTFRALFKNGSNNLDFNQLYKKVRISNTVKTPNKWPWIKRQIDQKTKWPYALNYFSKIKRSSVS